MPGSRSVVLLALASVLVLMLGAAAWCGGPVMGAPVMGCQPGLPCAPEDQVLGPGLSIWGSLGSGSVYGSNGVGPWVEFSDLEMKSNVVWGLGARFEPSISALGLGINASVLNTNLNGDATWTGFVAPPVFVPGSTLDSKLDLTLVSVTADLGLARPFLRPCGINIAPRIGWTQYIDRFKIENTTLGFSRSRHRSIAMFTVGLAGRVCLRTLFGGGYTELPRPARYLAPVVSAAAMLGDGQDMRFYKWEIFVGVFSTKLEGMFGELPIRLPSMLPAMPTLGVEVGWVRYDFNQKNQREEVLVDGFFRDANANYYIDIPTIRAVATF